MDTTSRCIMHDPLDTSSIASSRIYEIMEDKSEDLWVTTTVGLDKFNRKKESFHHIPYKQLLGKEGDHTIIAMAPGKTGKLWLGTWSGSILQLDIKTENLAEIEPEIEMGDQILEFYEDKNGKAWVGTLLMGYTFLTRKKVSDPSNITGLMPLMDIGLQAIRFHLFMKTMKELYG